jgi:hypothetical protein
VPSEGSVVASRAQAKVALCHRAGGGYVVLSVAANAVPAHLAHGDARVGDPAPGRPGLRLDASCVAVASPRTITVSGFRANATWSNSGPFTVPWAGPVHASAIVSSDYDLVQPLHLVLLDAAPGDRNDCSLVEALPAGGPMSPPLIEAHWEDVPPGDYCVDVQGPGAPPFSWQATVTLP